MSPSLSWKPRHYVWLVLVIAVAAFLYGRKIFIDDKKPVTDLTTGIDPKNKAANENDYTNTVIDSSFINNAIEEITQGPYPFSKAEGIDRKINITFTNGEKSETVELAGILLPEQVDPSLDAIKYLNNLLKNQPVRVETGKAADKTEYFIYSYVNKNRELLINITYHLLSRGLVVINEDEPLIDSERTEYMLAYNDQAKLDKVGIYATQKEPEKETGN